LAVVDIVFGCYKDRDILKNYKVFYINKKQGDFVGWQTTMAA
jgi:hypothetical protein